MSHSAADQTTMNRHVAVLCRDTILMLDIGMTLRDAGFTVTEITTMQLVPEVAENVSFAILDVGRDVRAAREVALTLDGRKIPMVLIHGTHDVSEDFADIPAAGRLEKPFLPASLVPIVARRLRDRPATRKDQSPV